MSTRCKINPRKWRDERTMRKEMRRVAWTLVRAEKDAGRGIMLLNAAEYLDNIKDHEKFLRVFRSNFIPQVSNENDG